MAKQINNWKKAEGSLNVTLYQNPFGKSVYYGRVSRHTVHLDTLIGMISSKHPGISEGMIQVVAGYLQEEILLLFGMGYTVDLLELGTLYLAPSGGIDGKHTKDVPTLVPRFTPSEVLVKKAASITVESVEVAPIGPQIEKIFDTSDKSGDGTTITVNRLIRLTGVHLKMAGNLKGLYLVPELAEGYLSDDENSWIFIKDKYIVTNKPKTIEFYVPEEAVVGNRYAIAVRTQYTSSDHELKTPNTGFSSVVTIK